MIFCGLTVLYDLISLGLWLFLASTIFLLAFSRSAEVYWFMLNCSYLYY
jgi:hypothetical protein